MPIFRRKSYAETILAEPGLVAYYRLGDAVSEARDIVEYMQANPEEVEKLKSLLTGEKFEGVLVYIEALEQRVRELQGEQSDAEAAMWNAMEQG